MNYHANPLVLLVVIARVALSAPPPGGYQTTFDSHEFRLDNYLNERVEGHVVRTTTAASPTATAPSRSGDNSTSTTQAANRSFF